MCAIGKLTGLHAFEQIHVFGNAAVAERRILARLGQRAAIGAHFVGGLAIDISVASGNQVFGKLPPSSRNSWRPDKDWFRRRFPRCNRANARRR
jgi:hypothetical protein